MIRLTRAVNAWGSPGFESVLKQEVEQLDPDQLPLQEGLSTASYAIGEGFSVLIMSYLDMGRFIRVKAGIFYSGVIAGCSCADDPKALEAQPEYCEVQIDIDSETARATIVLLTGSPV